jgi:BA14K-like protein
MINSRGIGAATAIALILLLAAPSDGLAQYRINQRISERPNALPRPPMRTRQPPPVAAPATSTYRNVAPVPPAAAYRIGDHDRERGAFAAGVAAGVVLGGATAAPGIYYVPTPSPADDPVAYCTQMYSSYDPQSGTYIGDDGAPHPCP